MHISILELLSIASSYEKAILFLHQKKVPISEILEALKASWGPQKALGTYLGGCCTPDFKSWFDLVISTDNKNEIETQIDSASGKSLLWFWLGFLVTRSLGYKNLECRLVFEIFRRDPNLTSFRWEWRAFMEFDENLIRCVVKGMGSAPPDENLTIFSLVPEHKIFVESIEEKKIEENKTEDNTALQQFIDEVNATKLPTERTLLMQRVYDDVLTLSDLAALSVQKHNRLACCAYIFGGLLYRTKNSAIRKKAWEHLFPNSQGGTPEENMRFYKAVRLFDPETRVKFLFKGDRYRKLFGMVKEPFVIEQLKSQEQSLGGTISPWERPVKDEKGCHLALNAFFAHLALTRQEVEKHLEEMEGEAIVKEHVEKAYSALEVPFEEFQEKTKRFSPGDLLFASYTFALRQKNAFSLIHTEYFDKGDAMPSLKDLTFSLVHEIYLNSSQKKANDKRKADEAQHSPYKVVKTKNI